MNIKPIRTPEDYQLALEMIDDLWTSKESTRDYDHFEILTLLIENYEREKWPIDLAHPIEALQYYMQQDGVSVEDLGAILGDLTLAKKVLDKVVPLTLPIVYQLYKHWKYPPVSFLNPYKLISDPVEEGLP